MTPPRTKAIRVLSGENVAWYPPSASFTTLLPSGSIVEIERPPTTIFEPSGAKLGSLPSAIRVTSVPSGFITKTDCQSSANAIFAGRGDCSGSRPQPTISADNATAMATARSTRVLVSSMAPNLSAPPVLGIPPADLLLRVRAGDQHGQYGL